MTIETIYSRIRDELAEFEGHSDYGFPQVSDVSYGPSTKGTFWHVLMPRSILSSHGPWTGVFYSQKSGLHVGSYEDSRYDSSRKAGGIEHAVELFSEEMQKVPAERMRLLRNFLQSGKYAEQIVSCLKLDADRYFSLAEQEYIHSLAPEVTGMLLNSPRV
jgi:hypothetical protein